MTDATPTLEPVAPEQIPRARALLAANDLPVGDLEEDPVRLYGLFDEGELVGVGGLEPYGSVALLRSVAVDESSRGRGLGTRLCESLEETATDMGVEALFLLTTSASAFFRERGYGEIDRPDVPPPIRRTAEFSELCPATAVCMRKALR